MCCEKSCQVTEVLFGSSQYLCSPHFDIMRDSTIWVRLFVLMPIFGNPGASTREEFEILFPNQRDVDKCLLQVRIKDLG